MPPRLLRSSALSTARLSLLAGCWKARSSLPSAVARNAQLSASASHSSITDAMLGRAVKGYEPPPPVRREKAVAPTPPSSQAMTIDSMLKSTGQSSQKSLGGFTKYLNNAVTTQTSISRSATRNQPMLTGRGKNDRKRSSSEMTGFAATLNRSNGFMDTVNLIDLTAERNSSVKNTATANPAYEFDPNDFDDDSELDLDIEYPQPLPPLSAVREPSNSIPSNLAQVSPSTVSLKGTTAKLQLPTSSAQTWSSSPPSHKLTPPGALLRRKAEVPAHIPSSEASIDANPRPAKRRTVPWLQEQAEERRKQEEADLNRDIESAGHAKAREIREDFTPLSKDKSMPWNTTASAVKEQLKAFKNIQKKTAKNDLMSLEDMKDVIRTTTQAKQTPLKLSEEQESVLNLVVKKGKSVFFTGSAGTGKSVLMRAIITELRKKHVKEPDRLAVTASTGLAACNIGGVTLHSYSGIGLGKEAVTELVKKISRNTKAKMRWLRTKVLIIDEVSMVDGELFDKLEAIARLLRKDGRPFGGIQLVITGDFFQLPPVPDHGTGRDVKFAFDAGTWPTVIMHTIGLTEVFRQKDPVFANMLNEMRLGKITDETVKAFRRLERPLKIEDSLEATELFPTRYEVDNANAMKMRYLQGKEFQFKAEDGGSMKDIAARDKLLANCMAPQLLTLKKGAQVMLIKNLDDNLVNGSLGTVVAFMSERTFEIYDNNPEILSAENDSEIEMGYTFRQAKEKLQSMIHKNLIGDTGKEYPLVRFTIADGTLRQILIQPEDWKVELPNGEVQAQRRQLPLILAWALSIHKAQGQTLQRVTVDLRKVFEKGQAYVALSRAVSQDGLQVKGFDKKKVMAHPRVGEFYNSLYSVNDALKQPKVRKHAVTKNGGYGDGFMENSPDHEHERGFDDDEEEALRAYG